MRLRVTYGRVADFLNDHTQQVVQGGLLVRVPDLRADRGAPVDLEVVTPVGRERVAGQVLQILAGAGVAVALDPAALAGLAAAAAAAARGGGDDGPSPVHELLEETGPAAHAAGAEAAGAAGEAGRDSSMQAQQAQKIQQALHGDKTQRMAILREPNKMLHGYVLRNPQLQLDEVVFIARMTTVAPDLLTYIAGRREWAERPEIASALVRNPKTPVPLAIRLLDRLGGAELRQLAKQTGVREAIQRAARKKVLG